MVGFKNRYMVMEVFLSPDNGFGIDDLIILTQFNISKAIKDSLLENFGECGLASSLISFQVKYVNSITKLCVIRASREEHNKVWAAITLVRRIGNCPVLFNLLDLSGEFEFDCFEIKNDMNLLSSVYVGSIKACRNAAVKCEEIKFEHYKLVLGDRLKDDNDINQQLKNSLEKIRTLEH